PQAFNVGNEPSAVAAVDLNGDGKTDLIAANAYDGSVSVLINNGPASYSVPPTITQSGSKLEVLGTSSPDTVRIHSNQKSQLVVRIDGLLQRFPISSITKVHVATGAANDNVVIGAGT